MNRKASIFSIVLIFFIGLAWAQKNREAVFAGRFYDQRPHILSQQVENYLKQAKSPDRKTTGLRALIVPHAGYPCSGPVAAYAYDLIKGLDIETVVFIGTSHRFGIRGCSVYPEGGYETPLGVAPVDRVLAQEIIRTSGFKYIP